jgi:hypothetical protein
VEDLPGEFSDSVDGGHVRRRQAAGRHDQVLGGYVVATIGLDLPPCRAFVEERFANPRPEADVPPQVEAVGDVPGVAQDLGLAGVALGPVPLLLQLLRKPVGVLHALHVAPGARIAVPVPRSADVVARLEHDRAQTGAPQTVKEVHPPEPGADDDRIHASGLTFPPPVAHLAPVRLRRICFTTSRRHPSITPVLGGGSDPRAPVG